MSAFRKLINLSALVNRSRCRLAGFGSRSYGRTLPFFPFWAIANGWMVCFMGMANVDATAEARVLALTFLYRFSYFAVWGGTPVKGM